MSDFAIYPIPLSSGTLAIAPIPGRGGRFESDLNTVLRWNPDLVLTMTTSEELRHAKAADLPARLQDAGTKWLHLPIPDFGAPDGETAENWPSASQTARDILNNGGRVLAHCYGGQGRSGMAVMRIMVELGYSPADALTRIRAVRPRAVETVEQEKWASHAL
nr:protein phosphatase [Amylibacter sp.]